MKLPDAFPFLVVNIGSGQEITIRGVAELVAEVIGYTGRIENDLSKPDGTPRKLSDISLIKSTGWAPQISLKTGLADAYQDFLKATSSQQLRSA